VNTKEAIMSAISPIEIDALSDTLNALFSALSDPTRRAMIARLSQGEASVNELAIPFKMSLPAVSKHIKVLEKSGLVTKTISAQQRPCKIDGVQLKLAVDWIDQYKQLWEGRFDRMDAFSKERQVVETGENTIDSKNATNNIATQAINTPARSVKSTKKANNQVNLLKTAWKDEKIAKTHKQAKPKEKNDDNSNPNDSSDLQQQIGFDF
jgi:DNA-binding transcriptional ArsR family regulator